MDCILLWGGGMRFGSRRSATMRLVLCCLVAVSNTLCAEDGPSSAYTILQKNCFSCHGAARTSGLDLRTSESALTGGRHGAVIVPNDPVQSKLYQVLTHEGE